jgi:hypothetical protein
LTHFEPFVVDEGLWDVDLVINLSEALGLVDLADAPFVGQAVTATLLNILDVFIPEFEPFRLVLQDLLLLENVLLSQHLLFVIIFANALNGLFVLHLFNQQGLLNFDLEGLPRLVCQRNLVLPFAFRGLFLVVAQERRGLLVAFL